MRKSTGAIFLDVEKAFDSVWHDGLLHKLYIQKCPIHIIRLIMGFLAGRRFAVQMDNATSSWRHMHAGLAQGSPLSPILYSIFTADFKTPKNCEVAFYADDTALLTSAKSSNATTKNLNRAMASTTKYFSHWKIKINTNKTQAIIFPFNRSRKRTPTVKLIAQGEEIQMAKEAVYLGVTLDAHLNFAQHVASISRRAYGKMSTLYPLLSKRQFALENKRMIFEAILRPTIVYAAPVWNEVAACHWNKLQIFQNKCMKTMHQLPWRFPTNELIEYTGVPKIKDFIEQEKIKFENRCSQSSERAIRELYA